MILKPLSELNNGEKGKIVKIKLGGRIRQRLTDMGMVTGSEIIMERVAPLGDPIEIKLKGYNLSLRKEVASRIDIEVI
ncbi:MAG: FeoA family protein [Dehalococcoidales bacterium]|nr:FeoA family protein [Dehalococcoidales bacterium]